MLLTGHNMSIDAGQLKNLIVNPYLTAAGLYSLSAEQLLLGTCAVETSMGSYIHQVNGPALGIWQMEAFSHQDIWINYLASRQDLSKRILYACNYLNVPHDSALIGNLGYACLMARVKYLRSPMALPAPGDVYNMSLMWKQVYNSGLGAGTEQKFQDMYIKYVSPLYQK